MPKNKLNSGQIDALVNKVIREIQLREDSIRATKLSRYHKSIDYKNRLKLINTLPEDIKKSLCGESSIEEYLDALFLKKIFRIHHYHMQWDIRQDVLEATLKDFDIDTLVETLTEKYFNQSIVE